MSNGGGLDLVVIIDVSPGNTVSVAVVKSFSQGMFPRAYKVDPFPFFPSSEEWIHWLLDVLLNQARILSPADAQSLLNPNLPEAAPTWMDTKKTRGLSNSDSQVETWRGETATCVDRNP